MKRLAAAALIACTMLGMSTSAFAAAPEAHAKPAASSASISPRAYEYEWRYASIEGRVHRRLYNLTLGRWEGDWIAC